MSQNTDFTVESDPSLSESGLSAPAGRGKRAGGRSARWALRLAPLTEELRPVRAGLSGGQYQPLSDDATQMIHEAALSVLSDIGISQAPASGTAALVKAGAIETPEGRLLFPRDLIEKTLEKAARKIVLPAQNPKHDLHLSGSKVHFGTAGAAVHLVDCTGKMYRESTLQDLYDAARIVDTLDNAHFFQRPMVCRDIADNAEMDINTVYASVSGTTKHVGTSFFDPEYLERTMPMLHLIAGGEEAWRARPFVSLSCTFVVPPLRFATEACLVMERAISKGMPVLLLSAAQAGATSPASIAGTVVQAIAECLAGLTYVNAISPGYPAIFGPWPFVSDLRTGAMSGGSAEQALITAACAHMGRFYGLPTGSAAGMSDAKLPDGQAGYEKGLSVVMAGLAGLNMVYESIGMQASLMGWCHEGAIIDNDMIAMALRTVRGIEVDESSLSLDTIRDVVLSGPGHYLGHQDTLNRMQRDYVYPMLGDRSSPKGWVEIGRPDLIENARQQKERILSSHIPDHIDKAMDQHIRDMVPVHLPPR